MLLQCSYGQMLIPDSTPAYAAVCTYSFQAFCIGLFLWGPTAPQDLPQE